MLCYPIFTVKKEVAEPFFQFSVFKYTFKGLLIKGRINFHIFLQNLGSNSKSLGALQKPVSNSKTLRGAIPPSLWPGQARGAEHCGQCCMLKIFFKQFNMINLTFYFFIFHLIFFFFFSSNCEQPKWRNKHTQGNGVCD